MFLMMPTIDELIQSEMTELVDMLARHSAEYSRLLNLEGKSQRTEATKEMIERLQQAIERKRLPINNRPFNI